MSGYPGDAMVQTGLWGERIQLLTKPFTRGELAGRVREILDHGNRA
jgi:hypothetical protein